MELFFFEMVVFSNVFSHYLLDEKKLREKNFVESMFMNLEYNPWNCFLRHFAFVCYHSTVVLRSSPTFITTLFLLMFIFHFFYIYSFQYYLLRFAKSRFPDNSIFCLHITENASR